MKLRELLIHRIVPARFVIILRILNHETVKNSKENTQDPWSQLRFSKPATISDFSKCTANVDHFKMCSVANLVPDENKQLYTGIPAPSPADTKNLPFTVG